MTATDDLSWPLAVSAGPFEDAARLLIEALRILDEVGSPAAARLSMVLNDLGVIAPVPRFCYADRELD